MTFLSLLSNSPLCEFLLYDDLLNVSMVNKYTHTIIDNDIQWNKFINNINMRYSDCAKKVLQIVKLSPKKITQILQINILSQDDIIETYDLELRRDYLLSYVIKTGKMNGLCFLIDYYLACEKMQIVYELIILLKEIIENKNIVFFSLDLIINEYNQQNEIKIEYINPLVFADVGTLVDVYINNYLFSEFFIYRIGDYSDDNIYKIMIAYASPSKKFILSIMNNHLDAMIKENIYNFFIGYCYSKMNQDICLEYFKKIDFNVAHFFCNELNMYMLNEFLKRKQIDYVKTCLKCMSHKKTLFRYDMYCNWASLCFDDENSTYDECMDVVNCMDILNKFSEVHELNDDDSCYNFFKLKLQIRLLLKFKKYNEIRDLFQENLTYEFQMLKDYYFFVLSIINKDKTLNYQKITNEDYIICMLLEKKYKNDNKTNTIGYKKLVIRKKIYSKIIYKTNYYFWKNVIDDICCN